MHNRGRTKVVGAINYYNINNIVYEHYHWVIYKKLFREELKPNFISQSNSIGVCNTICLFMFKGVLKNNCDDHFTFVVTTLGYSEQKKNFFVSSSSYKN